MTAETAMQDFVDQYLYKLDASEVVRHRVEEIMRFYAAAWNGAREPKLVFISETVGGDGQRVYENLWLIYDDVLCEAHNFLVEEKFDVTALRTIGWMVVERKDFDPGEVSLKSRLRAEFHFLDGSTHGTMRASGRNCERLWQICQEVLFPRAFVTHDTR